MIYTIGYQRLTAEQLQTVVTKLGAMLIDCRAKPVSRRAGFGGRQLEARFKGRYIQAGHFLGGFEQTTEPGLQWLRDMAAQGNVILMCMEEAPGECHRHHLICGPHFPEATHIYQDELLTAESLQSAIDRDTDYEIIGSLEKSLGVKWTTTA